MEERRPQTTRCMVSPFLLLCVAPHAAAMPIPNESARHKPKLDGGHSKSTAPGALTTLDPSGVLGGRLMLALPLLASCSLMLDDGGLFVCLLRSSPRLFDFSRLPAYVKNVNITSTARSVPIMSTANEHRSTNLNLLSAQQQLQLSH